MSYVDVPRCNNSDEAQTIVHEIGHVDPGNVHEAMIVYALEMVAASLCCGAHDSGPKRG